MLKVSVVKVFFSAGLPADSIAFGPEIQQMTNTAPGQSVDLGFGKKKVRVRIAGMPPGERDAKARAGTGSFLLLAKNLKTGLLLPAPLTLNLSVDQGKWRLGPLIGILANRSTKPGRPFGEQTSFFKTLNSEAKKLNAHFFAFCPEDITWREEKINGSCPPAEPSAAEWQTASLPFPDVIYDRGLFPTGEKRKAATKARRLLRNYPGVKLFNPAFFGKWKTHKLLARHDTLSQFLPDTKLYETPEDFSRYLNHYSTIYLKPSGGSSGRGIIKVSSHKPGFLISYRVSRQVKTRVCGTISQLSRDLLPLMGKKRYIIQQGLALAEYDKCPFDVRVLMQKNAQNTWLFTGMAARVASRGNYISNIHAGGQALRVSSVLARVFAKPQLETRIIKDIRRISLLIASWISAEGNPLFGEIAIDLGIDVSGRVWIIELNAIPGRSVFRRIKAMQILAQAVQRPMRYAYFLSGFTTHSTK